MPEMDAPRKKGHKTRFGAFQAPFRRIVRTDMTQNIGSRTILMHINALVRNSLYSAFPRSFQDSSACNQTGFNRPSNRILIIIM